MRKFTDFAKFKKPSRIFEQEITLNPQTPQTEVQPQAQVQQAQVQQAQVQQAQAQNKPEENKAEEAKTSVSAFFSKLLESREMAHVYHWQVKGDMGSGFAHLALQEYYENVIAFIDKMVEVYQGQYDLIEGYDIINTTPTKSKDRLEYFQEVVAYVKANRNVALSAEDTHIQNIVDEVIATLYHLIYKLRFNK